MGTAGDLQGTTGRTMPVDLPHLVRAHLSEATLPDKLLGGRTAVGTTRT